MNESFLRATLSVWVGSLLTICLVVAPSLFAVLDDRRLAGDLAGHFFRVASWLGVAFGSATLWLVSRSRGLRNHANFAMTFVTAVTPIANELMLRPFMEQARAQGNMQLFGWLHGVSALLFVCACVTGMVLLWRVNRPAT